MAALRDRLRWAIATVSLGKHPSHTVERKIKAAKANGFAGIELVWADLQGHAELNAQSPEESATQIRTCAEENDVAILSLNPLKWFEGNLETPLEERLDQARQWIDLATSLGTSIIQMPAQFLANSTGEDAVIVPELQALAARGAEKNITFAYEGVAFAKHNPLWQDALRVVELVDRPNFGLCMDSYHVHARLWGDARASSGVLPGGDEAVRRSLAEFVADCPRDKVLYMQFSDASRFDPPLADDSPYYDGLEVKDPRLAWSRSFRPFPLEAPGYFPMVDLAKAWLVDYAWQGWVSMESFLKETELEENGPEVMAARARKSIDALYAALE